MTGRVHIVRRAPSHYRLMFVPGGPDRHPIEGEDALPNFLLTDLEIPPGVTETAKPTSVEPSVTSAKPPKLAKRKPRRTVSRRTLGKSKPTRKAKLKGRSGR